jgi:hypothetical protein
MCIIGIGYAQAGSHPFERTALALSQRLEMRRIVFSEESLFVKSVDLNTAHKSRSCELLS